MYTNKYLLTVIFSLFSMRVFSQCQQEQLMESYVQEYVFSDSVFYDDLCQILTSNKTFINNNGEIQGDDFLVFRYWDTLQHSPSYISPNYQYNLSIEANYISAFEDFISHNGFIGVVKILNKDCFILKGTPKEITSTIFIFTGQKRRFTYPKDCMPTLGGAFIWNFLIDKDRQLLFKGVVVYE